MTGYSMTFRQISLFARVLTWCGFRVMAFEYDRDVLIGGVPQYLVDAIEYVTGQVSNDIKTHGVAGLYGISLGTMFAYHALKLDGIDKAIFSAGGCPLLRAVWDVPADGPARRNYQKNGYDRAAVEKIWKGYDITPGPHDLSGKRLLLLISESDMVIPNDFVQENIKLWGAEQNQLKVVTMKHLSHPVLIVRNMFRVYKTIQFYRHEGV